MRTRSILYGIGLVVVLATSAIAEPASNNTLSKSIAPKNYHQETLFPVQKAPIPEQYRISAAAERPIKSHTFNSKMLWAFVAWCCVAGQAFALGSMPAKELRSLSGLQQLFLEVCRSAERIIRSCGGKIGTRSEFSRFLQSDRTSVIALHFHSSKCLNQSEVCDSIGCLHQIYISRGKEYRLVFSQEASEMVENIGRNLMAAITISSKRFTRQF